MTRKGLYATAASPDTEGYLLTVTLYGRSTLYISLMTENSSVPVNPAIGL